MTNEFGEVICECCGQSFPEDMVQRDDETVCEECYIQRGIERTESMRDVI